MQHLQTSFYRCHFLRYNFLKKIYLSVFHLMYIDGADLSSVLVTSFVQSEVNVILCTIGQMIYVYETVQCLEFVVRDGPAWTV